jgi:hypothetical protein
MLSREGNPATKRREEALRMFFREERKPCKYSLEKRGNPEDTLQRIEETLWFPREERKPLNAP